MSPEECRKWIDNASYEELLRKWRFAPVGSPLLQGEVGEYYKEVLAKKRAEVGDMAHVRASKNIGW